MSDKPLTWEPWAVIAAVFALMVGGAIAMANDTHEHFAKVCIERWSKAGYTSRWKDGWGCQVEFEPGRWIDESRIKIELKGKQ